MPGQPPKTPNDKPESNDQTDWKNFATMTADQKDEFLAGLPEDERQKYEDWLIDQQENKP